MLPLHQSAAKDHRDPGHHPYFNPAPGCQRGNLPLQPQQHRLKRAICDLDRFRSCHLVLADNSVLRVRAANIDSDCKLTHGCTKRPRSSPRRTTRMLNPCSSIGRTRGHRKLAGRLQPGTPTLCIGLLDAGKIRNWLCKCGQPKARSTFAHPRRPQRASCAAKLKSECSDLRGLSEGDGSKTLLTH